jgi:hypothetical protein
LLSMSEVFMRRCWRTRSGRAIDSPGAESGRIR